MDVGKDPLKIYVEKEIDVAKVMVDDHKVYDLVAEISALRALVREMYSPACAELGAACEDLGKNYLDVLERALVVESPSTPEKGPPG